ncbi:protein kinase domain-containing protein [Polyangium jinanense]|uniref:Protein kinase n=1 Tax=Polyangium jinanense TaxID=2829994 RepID=A0A9X3XB70_9BACT|nr:protein kinase [Polyangium jinanense]MDC3958921.1 protein kinase [Polyangium jinanense]MDC3986035.1 protein kinase [Polyangium jinanense]
MKLIFHDRIGRGAAGEVWSAEDQLDRRVAVKFFNSTTPSRMEQDAIVHAKALARVRHPAVVVVHSVEDQPHPESKELRRAIIMEYVDGPPLSQLSATLSLQIVLLLMRQVAEALEAIHRTGIVHGDLHDGNVLIAGERATVVDILYTHSLAEVGSKTAARTRDEDLRDLAKVLRLFATRVDGVEQRLLEEAYFRACSGRTALDVFTAFQSVLQATAITPVPEQHRAEPEPSSAAKQRSDSPRLSPLSNATLEAPIDKPGSAATTGVPGQKILTQRQLDAAERLWNGVIALRDAVPSVLTLADVLLEHEYQGGLSNDNAKALIRNVSEDNVQKMFLESTDIERMRPFLSEPLWQAFFAYRAFVGRLSLLLIGRVGRGGPWYQDEPTLALLRKAITPEKVSDLLKLPLGRLTAARESFESAVLQQLQPILAPSGQHERP